MHFFHVPNPSTCILPEEESLHATKVLRLGVGDLIRLLDGRGGVYEAEITQPHAKRCCFRILSEIHMGTGRNYRLHVAIAPTKNIDRLEWFVEKAVEIGVDEITPLMCRYSERKKLNNDRADKILVAACKQSMQAVFPKLNTFTTFEQLVESATEDCKCIAHCYPLEKNDFNVYISGQKDILILIGPEGDFSADEVETAISKGFVPVSLGNSRLRTETAGILACAAALFA